MVEYNIKESLDLINQILGSYDYTNIEKAILILLYLYNDKVDIYKLHKMIFLASLDIKELKDELEPRPTMYKDIFYDKNIAEAIESLKIDELIEGDSTFILSEKGKKEAELLFSKLSEKEKDVFKEIIDLFKNATDDEILAIFYFRLDGLIKIIRPLYRIFKNRKKLAIDLYRKGKISISAASEIAGLTRIELIRLLKKEGLFP